MDIEKMREMVDRYLKGTATHLEKQSIENWLQTRQEDDQLPDAQHRQTVASTLWQTITDKTEEKVYPMRPYRLWIGYAAAIIIALTCSIWLMTVSRKKQPALAHTITAPRGSHQTAVLPDSSMVHLFPGATLTIADAYNIKERRITLTGRAFFEVKHDPSRPFYVYAGKMQTQVLATSFEVMAQDSSHASVIVRTGKVGVQYDGRHLAELTPDKRLRYDVQQHHMVIDEVNAALLCEWWSNGMVFKKAPLAEVMQMISDWYNMPVEITNTKWRQETVTIRIKDQSFPEVMTLLSEALGFQYKKENNRIIIY